MTAARVGLVALPLATLVLTWYAVRPRERRRGVVWTEERSDEGRGRRESADAARAERAPVLRSERQCCRPVVAPRRLAVARAAVIVGCFAVASVEILSAARWLTAVGVLIAWVVALATAGAGAIVRHRRDPADLGRLWSLERPPESKIAKTVLVVVGALVGAELVLALASPPNTYDSQTYHLPRVEHWTQHGSVELFPTAIHRQITYPPGAEFLLLHLRLLTGTDALYNLVQWSAGVLCLILVTRLGAQLGLTRRGQLLGALVVGSVPMVVLQSSSTQTDLIVAAWVTCVATLVLDGVGRDPARPADLRTALLIGGATGLVAVTKATGALVVGPLLVWWVLAQVRRSRRPAAAAALGRVAATVLIIVAGPVALAGPQVKRVYDLFGHPLGPQALRDSLTMQRRDPPSLLVNGLRQAHTLVDLPAPPVNRWSAERIKDLARAMGRDPSDRDITFYGQVFPAEAWYPHEDKAALPLHALLLLIGVVAALLHRGDRRRTVYAAVLVLAAVGFAVTFKWQPWGNRLLLFLVVPAAPLAGAWLDRVLSDGRRWARAAVVTVLAVAALAGLLSAAYGYPRRLVGGDSALVRDDWASRFATRPEWAASYLRAADAVKASGARRIGLVGQLDNWEYPWWLLLDGRELRSMQSPDPRRLPPVRPVDVDAVVCAGQMWHCANYVPAGWSFQHDGVVGWALPA